MGLIRGFKYNLAGLRLGLTTPKLLMMGLVRLGAMVAVTIIGMVLALTYHDALMSALWQRPESLWWIWLWYLASWLLAVVLVGMSVIVGYLVAQVLFSVLIMDLMSRHTEQIATGREVPPPPMGKLRWLVFLVGQEVPRAILPILIGLVLMAVGWLTPLGPILAVASSLAAAVFMAWDSTDLVPARRLEPFRRRWGRLTGNIGFHLGFGIWFLIPVLNLLFLSFAPVGGTLFAIESAGEKGE
ncbi:MAG: EI24 domain-containing protein [Desulfobacterales bacterium]|jgi:CysZ protein|nr:EI24 domain-containing protein [Desulfobacteraceae bacterium]MDD3991048.1 EI24 domain-containing protein [Desulfobacteraceae bacterium]MDY0311726.1 EI24 domain-containing protein [Desulfobacterales bacterium]